MSGKLSALIDAVAITGLIAFCFVFRVEPAPGKRSPASVSPISTKEAILTRGVASLSNLKHTEKIHGPLEVSIQLVGPTPQGAGDVFTLVGELSASENLSSVKYSWSIPDGVELLQGEPSGVLADLSTDQPTSLQITLKQLVSGNQQIHLIAGSNDGTRHFAESAQYNSEFQARIEAKKEALKEITEEETQHQLKVFH